MFLLRKTVDSREKAHEKARRQAARGELTRAIATLTSWLGGDAGDDRTLLKLADLHRRHGDDAAAAAAFARAAELYSARGFALKAAASLRQAVAAAPDDLSLLERLGEVDAELGLTREAAILLEQVAAAVAETGDRARLVALRRRILLLLPADAGAVIRLADLLVEGGEREEPIRLLEQASEALREHGQLEVWFVVQERLVALRPDDRELAKELARRLLYHASPKRALVRLKACLAADPGDVETLALLARAFETLALVPKAAASWREIARVHQRAGRDDAAKGAWEKVLELAPGDVEATTALAPPELPPHDPSATLDDELAEAAFLAEQGAVTDARAILLRLRELHPESREVAGGLQAVDVETLAPEHLIEDDDEELFFFEGSARDSTTAILDRLPPDLAVQVAESVGHRELAAAFAEMERWEEALAELEKAAAYDPQGAEACRPLAERCRQALGVPAAEPVSAPGATVLPWTATPPPPADSPSPASAPASSA